MKSISELKEEINKISASKHNPIYNSSMYWSQKAYNITDLLIENFTNAGDFIFDPFMGSGVTVIEAVSDKYKRIGVGSEINDAPIFITDMALKKINDNSYERLLELNKELAQLSKDLYLVKCPDCGSNGLISSVIFDSNSIQIKLKNINFQCSNKSCKCKNKVPSQIDYDNIMHNYKINKIKDEELIYNSKIAVSKNMYISNIFTRRNFKALDEIIKLKEEKYMDISDIIDYILLSMIHLCKITDTHSNSQWPLWTPKTNCVEKNVFSIFDRKVKKFKDFIKYKNENYTSCKKKNVFSELNQNSNYLILSCGTQNITNDQIPDNSIDFILTDPPYMGQVLYSEYMQLYRPFLNFNFNLTDEIVVSSAPSRNKKEEVYFNTLEEAFKLCGRKLKNKKYMAMYFHDCNLSVWNRLIKILEKSGFEYLSQTHIDKTITLKNIISPKKSLNGDSILFFIKNDDCSIVEGKKKWSDEIEYNIYLESKRMLENKPLSTPELYDNGLMEIIIQNGWLDVLSKKYKSLVDIFEKYFIWENETARWKKKE